MELKIIPAVQVIIVMLLMKVIHHTLPSFNYVMSHSASLVLLFTALATIIGFLAVFSFRKHKTTVNPSKPELSSKVVNTGIYHFSRNPMYLAMLLALIAFAFHLENLLTFLLCPVFFAYIGKYQILPEELMLKKLFGAEYLMYQQQVRRWL